MVYGTETSMGYVLVEKPGGKVHVSYRVPETENIKDYKGLTVCGKEYRIRNWLLKGLFKEKTKDKVTCENCKWLMQDLNNNRLTIAREYEDISVGREPEDFTLEDEPLVYNPKKPLTSFEKVMYLLKGLIE
jgi:hypothetical protein